MAKSPKEIQIFTSKILPWVDEVEYPRDDFYQRITFKKSTPDNVKLLFKELEPKLKNVELKR